MNRRFARLCAGLALASLLGGCVAVAALPVLASGAMVAGGNVRIRAATPRPKVKKSAAPRRAERTAGAPADAPGALAAARSGVAGAPGLRLGDVPSDAEVLSALDPWRPFLAYAQAQAELAQEPGKLRSVLLNPSAPLTVPKRRDCQTETPAVAIDLDAQTTPFDPAAARSAARGLAEGLARLREAGVVVVWIASSPAREVGAVAEALRRTGLDPQGNDPLLLLRSDDDRKQALRQQANRDVCVVAIAGDRKGDFDELFDYLRDPASAWPLDTLLGFGWFLTPPPLG